MPGLDGFGLENLPYGVFTHAADDRRRIGVAFGGQVLDAGAAAAGTPFAPLLQAPTLDPLLAAGRPTWRAVRAALRGWLGAPSRVVPHLLDRASVRMHLPFEVADYVDFYASEQHARAVGAILRPGAEPLPPNWKNLPIGYHGRAGTVVISGAAIRRPRGQTNTDGHLTVGPTGRLDLEAELGFVVGRPSVPGTSVGLADFREHVFGVCLVNDWSARDIQAWEYVPLGPFLGKSFATSVSPWVVPLEALEAAWVQPPRRDVPLLDYLDDGGAPPFGLDISMRISINGTVVSRPPFAGMYWTGAQMLAHLTVNGASLRTGDLFASGTVSGSGPGEAGSLIELTHNGEHPIELAHGAVRGYLMDGDEVIIDAVAPGRDGALISLGEVRGRVLPAGAGLPDAGCG